MSALLIVATLLLTAAGQIAQKLTVLRWQTLPSGSAWTARLGNCWPWLALISLGLGLLCWLAVLQRMEVSLAYPMLSLNFVLITVAARVLFDERIDRQHLFGLGLVIAGVCLLGGQP